MSGITNGKGRGFKHGYRYHPLYDIWCHIKDRCLNSNNPAYHNYGGRGITICEEWLNPKIFIVWCLNNGWHPDLEIDRKENNGIYESTNCRFVTRKINSFNRRTNVLLEYNGELYKTIQLEELSGISANRILRRVRDHGWTVENAISVPVRKSALKEEIKISAYQSL